jgi:hypothetical protein
MKMKRRRRNNPIPKWAILGGAAALVGGFALWYFVLRRKGGSFASGSAAGGGAATSGCSEVADTINKLQPLGKMLSKPILACRAAGGQVQWLNAGTDGAKQVCVCQGAPLPLKGLGISIAHQNSQAAHQAMHAARQQQAAVGRNVAQSVRYAQQQHRLSAQAAKLQSKAAAAGAQSSLYNTAAINAEFPQGVSGWSDELSLQSMNLDGERF